MGVPLQYSTLPLTITYLLLFLSFSYSRYISGHACYVMLCLIMYVHISFYISFAPLLLSSNIFSPKIINHFTIRLYLVFFTIKSLYLYNKISHWLHFDKKNQILFHYLNKIVSVHCIKCFREMQQLKLPIATTVTTYIKQWVPKSEKSHIYITY